MPPVEKKGVGFVPSEKPHYTDHLAVVCAIMNVPLLFIEEQEYLLGKKYYPEVDARQLEYEGFSSEYLIEHYDVLFLSDYWDRQEFHTKYAPLEKKYKKRMRLVHCPHGFSDKGFYLKKCANEDIVLVYGQNMLDQFQHCGVFDHLHSYVITGNMRYPYFKKHQKFYDRIIQDEILSHFDQKRPIILYAPTWMDLEESSTFFDAHKEVIGALPSDYNMIVKLHPRLEYDDTIKYYQIVGQYENNPNVLFLKDFPLIYPLLAHTDLYIGDSSAIGYDFLTFNKPMFFLNKYKRDSKEERLYLYQCGVEVLPEEYSQLYQIIAKNLPSDQKKFKKIRNDLYRYTFGEERPFTAIREDIVQAYNTEERPIPTATF